MGFVDDLNAVVLVGSEVVHLFLHPLGSFYVTIFATVKESIFVCIDNGCIEDQVLSAFELVGLGARVVSWSGENCPLPVPFIMPFS